MTYLLLTIFAIFLIGLMYIQSINTTNKDLKRQKQNLQTKIVQEKTKSNIKEFQAYQKAKKEMIKKEMKKEANETKSNKINLTTGIHTIKF